MEALIGLLCGATVFFAFVTVIGHGLWVLIAALFKPTTPATRSYRPCPACGAVLAEHATACHACGQSLAQSSRLPATNEVAVAIRQLQRLQNRGLLDANELERLIALLQAGDFGPVGSTPSPAVSATPTVVAPAAGEDTEATLGLGGTRGD